MTSDDLARIPVSFQNGSALKLGDVADVREGFAPPIGDAVINDMPGLLLIVEKQPWGNTLEVTRNVEAALNDLRPGLTGLEIDSTIFRPATFIERAIGNLNHALLLGCLLVVMVLAAFLFEWRTALISLLAIPLSLITAMLVLHWWGSTVNTMVLAGLVLALGEVVDDAIIDVENIVRRLRINREEGRSGVAAPRRAPARRSKSAARSSTRRSSSSSSSCRSSFSTGSRGRSSARLPWPTCSPCSHRSAWR